MLAEIIGAVMGERASEDVSGVSGTGGALLGAGAVALLTRLGPVALIGIALGAYAYKRYSDQQADAKAGISPRYSDYA